MLWAIFPGADTQGLDPVAGKVTAHSNGVEPVNFQRRSPRAGRTRGHQVVFGIFLDEIRAGAGIECVGHYSVRCSARRWLIESSGKRDLNGQFG
jgi:hypothetical protein